LQKQDRKRILLGQLGAFGDCLYATTIARQIKLDYRGCHLTWAIGSMCRPILKENPYVDDIWEVPLKDHAEMGEAWRQFENEAFLRKELGEFDEVFLTQIDPNNFQNFDGTVRSSLFRGYPKPITVPVAPFLRLTSSEIENVRCFAESHHLPDTANVILFECSSRSGQSFVTPHFALEVAKQLVMIIPDMCIVISSNIPIKSSNERIIDGSILPFRDNAELTKYCSLLVGCSSGISWLCTSECAKPLPMIQLLKADKSVYSSFVHDYEYRGMSTEAIIEMTECYPEKLVQCIVAVLEEGFATARSIYHEKIPLHFKYYCDVLFDRLVMQGKFVKAICSLTYTCERYGIHPSLIKCIIAKVMTYGRKVPTKLTRVFKRIMTPP
jgi:hypothetical protein